VTEETVVHVRTIRIEARRVGADELHLVGHLVDDQPEARPRWFTDATSGTKHDMSVTLGVRFPDLTIRRAEGVMREYPYTVCTAPLASLERLVGLGIGRGFTRALNERLGRDRGCSHLTALVHAMAPVVAQAADAAFHDLSTPPDAGGAWVGTCHAWRHDGPLVHAFAADEQSTLVTLLRRAPRSARDSD
jgi:hypothetical protein